MELVLDTLLSVCICEYRAHPLIEDNMQGMGKVGEISIEVCHCIKTPTTPALDASETPMLASNRTILPFTSLSSNELVWQFLPF